MGFPPWAFGLYGVGFPPLSLSQIKSEHIDGVARRELGDQECLCDLAEAAVPVIRLLGHYGLPQGANSKLTRRLVSP